MEGQGKAVKGHRKAVEGSDRRYRLGRWPRPVVDNMPPLRTPRTETGTWGATSTDCKMYPGAARCRHPPFLAAAFTSSVVLSPESVPSSSAAGLLPTSEDDTASNCLLSPLLPSRPWERREKQRLYLLTSPSSSPACSSSSSSTERDMSIGCKRFLFKLLIYHQLSSPLSSPLLLSPPFFSLLFSLFAFLLLLPVHCGQSAAVRGVLGAGLCLGRVLRAEVAWGRGLLGAHRVDDETHQLHHHIGSGQIPQQSSIPFAAQRARAINI